MPRIYTNAGGALERAVRPFVADPPKPRQERPKPTQDDSVAVISWSCTTHVEVVSISATGFSVVSSYDEAFRQTHVKRVSNPNDPAQFVDVEVIDAIDFRAPGGGRVKYRYNN